MGAPTLTHESRVAHLETLATLAAFTTPVALPWRLRPDVARINEAHRGLFLGDAKATETPGCSATLARLHWYAVGLRALEIDVARAVVALAVDDARYGRGWQRALLSTFVGDVVSVNRTSIAVFDGTAIVGLDLALAPR